MSATLLTLTNGETVVIRQPLTEMTAVFQQALVTSVPWELKARDGGRLVINPLQVQYLQEASAGQP